MASSEAICRLSDILVLEDDIKQNKRNETINQKMPNN
jgi:hypothetical protein